MPAVSVCASFVLSLFSFCRCFCRPVRRSPFQFSSKLFPPSYLSSVSVPPFISLPVFFKANPSLPSVLFLPVNMPAVTRNRSTASRSSPARLRRSTNAPSPRGRGGRSRLGQTSAPVPRLHRPNTRHQLLLRAMSRTRQSQARPPSADQAARDDLLQLVRDGFQAITERLSSFTANPSTEDPTPPATQDSTPPAVQNPTPPTNEAVDPEVSLSTPLLDPVSGTVYCMCVCVAFNGCVEVFIVLCVCILCLACVKAYTQLGACVC